MGWCKHLHADTCVPVKKHSVAPNKKGCFLMFLEAAGFFYLLTRWKTIRDEKRQKGTEKMPLCFFRTGAVGCLLPAVCKSECPHYNVKEVWEKNTRAMSTHQRCRKYQEEMKNLEALAYMITEISFKSGSCLGYQQCLFHGCFRYCRLIRC